MSNSFDDTKNPSSETPSQTPNHTGAFIALGAGLIIALGGCAYLGTRVSQMTDQMTQMQDSTKSQIASCSSATTSLLSLVWESNMVRTMPLTLSRGFIRRLTSWIVSSSLATP